jgi:hypothetical protein
MSNLSDYVIYVDESGDHSLAKVNPQFPLFVLAFCIMRKEDYANHISAGIQRLKLRWFGHDAVVLHEKEIIRKEGPFSFLQNTMARNAFMAELTGIMAHAPMVVVSAIIHKTRLAERYREPMNPYDIALLFCLERSWAYLQEHDNHNAVTHIIAESRSPRAASKGREDQELADTFNAAVKGELKLQTGRLTYPHFSLSFASKQANLIGLQIADLVARPIGLSVLRPEQENRAFDVIAKKIWRYNDVAKRHSGLKIFP